MVPNFATAGGPPQPTIDAAKAAGLRGWNLRCNRCGLYGARWLAGERPGFGALALCDPHAAELLAENRRHTAMLAELRAVNYEQEPEPGRGRRNR